MEAMLPVNSRNINMNLVLLTLGLVTQVERMLGYTAGCDIVCVKRYRLLNVWIVSLASAASLRHCNPWRNPPSLQATCASREKNSKTAAAAFSL